MKIITGARQTGKTTKMIQWIGQDLSKRFLVTFSTREQDRLRRQYPSCKDNIFTYQSFREKAMTARFDDSQVEVAVDNADYILEQVVGTFVRIATFNKEELTLREK
jgi:hypothetical protein